MDLAVLAQQTTDILVPALSALCIAGKTVADKGKEVLEDMIYEKVFEKLGKESAERATLLLKKINPKIGSSLEKALKKISGSPEDSAAKEDLQQEILKLLKENPDLAKEIELIVNINIKIDVVKQLVFGNNNLVLNLEGIKGEELIKVMEYMDWKRQEELKQEVLNSYNLSVLPDYSETLIKLVTENRAEELSLALKHLQKNKILLFSGIAGVGKTTLMRVLVNFRPTGVPEPFWFNFYHNRDANLEDVLEALAAYLQVPEILSFKGKKQAGYTDINRLTEELRKRNSVWLVFDDLSYMINEKRNFIDPGLGLLFKALRDNTHNAKIILTSRFMPLLDNGEYLIDELEDKNRQKIEGLNPDFAINYLRANGFDGIELKTLESLVESVDGHPFSLKLLVGLAKKYTAESILKDLTFYRKHQKDRIKNARFLFDKLVDGEKELLERVSVYRQPEDLESIKIMFTDSVPVDSVDALLDKSLLETDHKGKYWLHPLVQEFSYEDLKDKKEAHMLAVKYYLSIPLPEKPSGKEDIQQLIEADHHACMAGEYDLAAVIILKSNLNYLLDLWGNSTISIEIFEKLLLEDHSKGETILKDKRVHEYILRNLGLAYSHMGNLKKSIEYYEQALKISRELSDRQREGANFGNLGIAYSNLGESKKAIGYSDQSLKISREFGDRQGECVDLGNLGVAYSNLGEPKKAIQYYEQALKIANEIDDRREEGNNLGNLGNAFIQLGEPKKAIEYYEQTLKISKEISDKHGECIGLGNLGLAYIHMGNPKKAIEYYEQALKIYRLIEDRRGESIVFGNLGLAHHDLGNPRKEVEYYKQALMISKEIGDSSGEIVYLENLGNAYSHMGNPKKVIEYYEKALEISKEIGDLRGERNNLGNLGSEYYNLGETGKAIEYYEKALKISKETDDKRGEGDTLGNLALVYNYLGEIKKAAEYNEQKLEILRDIGEREKEGETLENLALIYRFLEEIENAIKYHEQALEIFKEIGDKKREAASCGNLGSIYLQMGRVKEAVKYNLQAIEIFKKIGNLEGEGALSITMGVAYSRLGEIGKAVEFYERALEISKEAGNQEQEMALLEELGHLYINLREIQKATECYEQVLRVSREIEDRQAKGNQFSNLGLVYSLSGKTEKAAEHYEQAVELFRGEGDRINEGFALSNLGVMYSHLGEAKKAIKHYQQALEIFKELGEREGEGDQFLHLGLEYGKLGEKEKAIECYEQVLLISREFGDRRQEEFLIGKISDLQETKKKTGYQKTEVPKEPEEKNKDHFHKFSKRLKSILKNSKN